MAVPLHHLSNRALMQRYMSCRAQAIMRSLSGECSALEEKPTLWFTRVLGCVAARCGQDSVDPKVCRLQLFVGDPSILSGGTPDECAREFDVIELFWPTQGFHSSLEQGKPHCRSQQEEQFDTGFHDWIGIPYALRGNLAVMSPSAPFVASACEARRPFTQRHGIESIKPARCAVGEAARAAQVGGRLESRRAQIWRRMEWQKELRDESKTELRQYWSSLFSNGVFLLFTKYARLNGRWPDILCTSFNRPFGGPIVPFGAEKISAPDRQKGQGGVHGFRSKLPLGALMGFAVNAADCMW